MPGLDKLTPSELLVAVCRDYLTDSFLAETPFLGVMAANTIMQEQLQIEWGVKVAQGTATGRAVTAPLSNDNVATIKDALITIPGWYVKHQFEVVKQQVVYAVKTGRITAVKNPIRTQMTDAMDIFATKISKILYLGNGVENDANAGVYGLNSIVGQTGTYAGIDRTVYPHWKSILKQGATPGTPEAWTIDRFSDLLGQRRLAGVTHRPNNGNRLMMVTTDNIENKVLRKLYHSVATEESNFMTQTSKDILPYSSYNVRGIPVMSDVDCPANTAYLINLSKLGLYGFDQSSADDDNPKIQYIPLRYTPDTDGDPLDTSLVVRVADVSNEHPDIMRFELSTRLQMVAYDPIDAVTKIEDILDT